MLTASLKILSPDEISTVLLDLRRRARRSESARLDLVIFRLSGCCGLRVCEIAGLNLSHLRLGCQKPHIAVPASIAKYGRSRVVPLWWDSGTLADLELWKANRLEDGATGSDPVICSTRSHRRGQRLTRGPIQQRWNRRMRISLGEDRAAGLSIHCGRHTFCSTALAGGKSLAQVRDAAGHSNVKVTSVYLHSIDDGTIGDLFGAKPAAVETVYAL